MGEQGQHLGIALPTPAIHAWAGAEPGAECMQCMVTCFISSSAGCFQVVHQKLELPLCTFGILVSAIMHVV